LEVARLSENPTILLCNDDGYFAEGLRVLREALMPLGRVVVVAPQQDCSGVSHKITIDQAMRLRKVDTDFFAANGSPVDCIHLGLHGVLEGQKPDLVVSGINHGPNLGEDTTYSGTVSAAYEGFLNGIPSLAVSTGRHEGRFHFKNAARFAYKLAAKALKGDDLFKQAVWSLNVPPEPCKGIKVCRLDSRSFQGRLVKREDPRGRPYYWHGPYYPEFAATEDSDYAYYKSGYAALTPIKVEMTHHDLLSQKDKLSSGLGDLIVEN
jgi:5'-nucleotidase